MPLRPSFRRAFTRSYELDPLRRAGYSPELGGHTPPIDFCSCQDFRARPRTVRLRLHTSRRDESRRAGDDPLLAKRTSRVFTAQGSLAPRTRPRNPRDDVRCVDRGFTPTCSELRHPLSPADTRRGSETSLDERPYGSPAASSQRRRVWVPPRHAPSCLATSWRINAPGPPHRSATRLEGPPLTIGSRNRLVIDRTRGAFHLRVPLPLLESR